MNINYLDLIKFLKFENFKQEKTINLIASENYSSLTSIIYSSSCFINKYTEGYPFNRYYSGCKFFDILENKSILEAQNLFFSNFVNVQPHSGVQANFASFQSILENNEKIISLDLKSGGHLSHGFSKNFSSKCYNIIHYYLDKKNLFNYKYIELIIKYEKPKVLIVGYSSFQGIIDWKQLWFLTNKNNCFLISDISHISGLISSGLIFNPIKFSNIITSTTHKTLRGVKGGIILSNCKKIIKKINNSVFPGQQGGCISNNIIGKYISFKESNSYDFVKYTKQILINSKIMLKTFLYRNFSSILENTCNHMFLIILKDKNSALIEKILEKFGILINKNFIPKDNKSSLNPSSIRIGLSCITTRKFKNNEVELITNYICDILENKIKNIKYYIRILTKMFPIYK